MCASCTISWGNKALTHKAGRSSCRPSASDVSMVLHMSASLSPCCQSRQASLLQVLDVVAAHAGKSYKELVELEAGIEKELESGTAADPEFMSAVLKRLTLHKAKARLKEIHQGLLAKHAERIIATQDPSMDIRKAMGWHIDEVGSMFTAVLESPTLQTHDPG